MNTAKKVVDAYLKLDESEQRVAVRRILKSVPDQRWTAEISPATKRLQDHAKRKGLQRMSLREINAEIAAARRTMARTSGR